MPLSNSGEQLGSDSSLGTSLQPSSKLSPPTSANEEQSLVEIDLEAESEVPAIPDAASEVAQREPTLLPLSPLAFVLDPPWANNRHWPLDFVFAILIGAVLGAIAFPFVEVVEKVPLWWLTKTGQGNNLENSWDFDFRAGSLWWVLICCVGGAIVGVLKASLGLDAYPSFIIDLKHQEIHPWTSARVCVCCIGSLCAGATLGPEAGLGALGGAIGHFFALGVQRFCPCMAKSPKEIDLRRRSYILCGMASAFGATFPSPFSACLLVGEISSGGTQQDNQEILGARRLSKRANALMVPAATFAFAVRYLLAPVEEFQHPGQYQNYTSWSTLISLGLSVVAAMVGFFFIIVSEVTRLMIGSLGSRIEFRFGKALRIIVLASLTGAAIGGLLYLFPLCVGSGSGMVRPTLEHATTIPTWVLAGACVAKILTFSLSAAGGFVGGMFFPLMYIGVLAGEVCANIFHIPRVLAVSIMMASVPGSVITAPLSMVALPMGMFAHGPLQSVPVFFAVIMSNKLLLGTGLLHKLLVHPRTRRRSRG